tara:strand:- start:2538 stop:3038 length:501 start_codon:yes stop_codon:yes gene_type:complete
MMTTYGRIWKYGDDINTDIIFPGKYTYTLQKIEDIVKHALEDLDPTFAKKVQPGDIIVAGKNFGNGSSREQAVTCIKESGIIAVIATSFARIWYRNAINNGLPAIICPEAVSYAKHGSIGKVELKNQTILIDDKSYNFPKFSSTALNIMEHGSLIKYVQYNLRNKI